MTVLRKKITTTIIPGNPGTPAIPGHPGTPARCSTTTTTTYLTAIDYAISARPSSSSQPAPGVDGIGMANGYDSYQDSTYSSSFSAARIPVTTTTQTCHPAVPAVPGRAGSPPSPHQIIRSLNKGWNSWARSIEPAARGEFARVTVAPGVEAAFLGLGLRNMEGRPLQLYAHGLLVDLTGVWVFESGVKKIRLAFSHGGTTDMRIVRHADLSVAYLVKTGTETTIHTSEVAASPLTLYGYGYLYSGGDQITSAGLVTGSVQYGRA